MTFQSSSETAFTDSDITSLQTMADQVANSIETASLFDERDKLIHELEKKNTELEQFAYTVSHDLKSPVVTIRGFLGYLQEDARRGDLVRFEKDMERVVKATERMQSLLSDLLNLSKVGRTVDVFEDIDFAGLVRETAGLVVSPYPEGKIDLEIQPSMPWVRCDRTRMVQVIQNLVVNAIKFSVNQSVPSIKIGTAGNDPRTDFPIFFVSDNGIGIEPKYHEQVFGLFNRLNPEIEGTGIGLTLVKRIIELHGGRIWIDSVGDNRGSTFYFTLPPAGPRNE
jgi:signal transduction histidine kinase